MSRTKTRFTASLLALLLGFAAAFPVMADSDKTRLFVNLTSSEVARAGMALELARNVLKQGHPVTVFLNVDGVRIASPTIPQATNGITGKSLQMMLEDIIAEGGQVIACPMCLRQAGIGESELIKGVEVGKPELTLPAMLGENTRIISY